MNTRKSPRYSNRQYLVKGVQNASGRTLETVNDEQKQPADQTPETPARAGSAAGLTGALAIYTIARLALVALITLLIMFVPRIFGVEPPLIVALAFGVLIAMPLGMFLFKSMRNRVNDQITAVDDERRRKHDDLQSRLRGNNS